LRSGSGYFWLNSKKTSLLKYFDKGNILLCPTILCFEGTVQTDSHPLGFILILLAYTVNILVESIPVPLAVLRHVFLNSSPSVCALPSYLVPLPVYLAALVSHLRMADGCNDTSATSHVTQYWCNSSHPWRQSLASARRLPRILHTLAVVCSGYPTRTYVSSYGL